MAYDGRVYRVLIASPSDVEEEREIAVRVIQEWNDLHSYNRKVVLLPLRWETHTAPELGTRPQEIVNRAIVEECDLLVGIFWTRLGSPTGVAASGTLEEIQRVGAAGKPIMLYFSRVAIDPDRLDLEQVAQLQKFKQETYPKGLVENYGRIIDFRDKFSKQLEIKIRELQNSETSGSRPLSLNFLSVETAEPIGNFLQISREQPMVHNFNDIPENLRDSAVAILKSKIKELFYIPIVLSVENHSSAGVRSAYCEFDFSADHPDAELSDSLGSSNWLLYSATISSMFPGRAQRSPGRDIASRFERFEADHLQKTGNGWRLSLEWDAIQPQRTRIVKPFLFLYSPHSTKMLIKARVFSDSFPRPIELEASLELGITPKEVSLNMILPDWKEILKDRAERSAEGTALSRLARVGTSI